MDNNQNNMGQNGYYNNDSYYTSNGYNDSYNNASYTQEKRGNGLWWKLLLLIILIVIIILLLLKFCGSGSKKTADQKFTELSNRICEAAKKHIGNNPTLMGSAEPGKSVVIKLQTLADADLIETQIENPNYDGNLFKKGTEERYYSLSNSVRVTVSGDGSYYCELVDNSKDVTPPELRLNGDIEITMTVGTDFEDPGYTATDDFDGDITDKVVLSGNVDNSKAGTYTITYSVQDSAGNPASKTRTIIYTEFKDSSITLGSILDGVTPMIKLRGANPFCMVKGTQYEEPGAMATDNVDGNITDRIVVTNKVTGNLLGTFRLVYTVEDSSGNKAIAYRAVIVSTECPDVVAEPEKEVNHAPEITLVGKNSVTINKGTEYIDLGATAYDKEDGDLTSKITTDATQVNVNSAGIYKVIYRVTDSGGKTTTKTRIVTVKDNVAGNPQVRFTENKANITVIVGEGSDSLLVAPKAVNENGVQVNVTKKIEDYTTKQAVNAIDWSKVGKYRVIYTAVHGNGTLKQTKTIVVTIVDGKVTIGGKDTIEVDLRETNCDINEADLVKGGVTFTAPGSATPIVTLTGHEGKACVVGTYEITANAKTNNGEESSKKIVVKVVDKGTTTISKDAPGKVIITDNSANAADVYNTNNKWAGGTVTGITLVFTSTPATGTEIGKFEYSKSCNTVDGSISKIGSSTGTLTWTEEGKYEVCIRAVNTEGAAGLWSDPVKLYLDKTGPKVEFTHTWKDGKEDWHNTSLTLEYKATDEGSGLDHFEYTYDDVKAKKSNEIVTYNEATGKLTVNENTEPSRPQLFVFVRAVDKVGNKGEWTLNPAYANIDTVKPATPTVIVTGNKTSIVKLNATFKDGESVRPSGFGKLIYTLNEGEEKEERSTVITMPSNATQANVDYSVKVWAVDKAGNRSDGYANESVTVAPAKTPVTGVDLANGSNKISNGGACSTTAIYPQGTFTLVATPIPTNADIKDVTWSIDNANVATIDTNGKVTAKAVGTATITAKIEDKTTKCVLTVTSQPSNVGSSGGNQTVTCNVENCAWCSSTNYCGSCKDGTLTNGQCMKACNCYNGAGDKVSGSNKTKSECANIAGQYDNGCYWGETRDFTSSIICCARGSSQGVNYSQETSASCTRNGGIVTATPVGGCKGHSCSVGFERNSSGNCVQSGNSPSGNSQINYTRRTYTRQEKISGKCTYTKGEVVTVNKFLDCNSDLTCPGAPSGYTFISNTCTKSYSAWSLSKTESGLASCTPVNSSSCSACTQYTTCSKQNAAGGR